MVYIPAQNKDFRPSTTSTSNSSVSSSTTVYELPPRDAGPVTAKIHDTSKELANRLAQLITETIKIAADSNGGAVGPDGPINQHEATIHILKLKLEQMKWEHEQQINELKHNNGKNGFILIFLIL